MVEKEAVGSSSARGSAEGEGGGEVSVGHVGRGGQDGWRRSRGNVLSTKQYVLSNFSIEIGWPASSVAFTNPKAPLSTIREKWSATWAIPQ